MKTETKEKLEAFQDATADILLNPVHTEDEEPEKVKLIADTERIFVETAKAETEKLNAETRNIEAQVKLKTAEAEDKKADAMLREAKTKAGNAVFDRIASVGQLGVSITLAGTAVFTVLKDLPTGKFADMAIRSVGNFGKTLPKLFK